jgi:hypothetical protein
MQKIKRRTAAFGLERHHRGRFLFGYRGRFAFVAIFLINDRPQFLDGGILKKRQDRKIAAQRLVDLVDQPNRQDGVAAQLEEAVLDTDFFQTEDFAPKLRQSYFRRGAGRDELVLIDSHLEIGLGQRLAV